MGSLKDELLKSGLIDKKKAKKAEHDRRVRHKKGGGVEGQRKERAQRQREFEDKRAEQRRQDRAREQARREAAKQGEEALQAVDLIERESLRRGIAGPRKFHFVAEDRQIPYLEVADDVARKLESGQLAIVQRGEGFDAVFNVVPRPAAEQLGQLRPEAVRFFNREGRSRR